MVNNSPNYDQIAFDMAFTHLAEQGVPANSDVDPSMCLYRAHRGDGRCLKCGLGALIGDEEYRPRMEKVDWTDPLILDAIAVMVGGRASEELLGDIQKTHDVSYPSNWRRSARRMARRHNLSTATIDALDWSACEATA